MKVLILGAKGMLGGALKKIYPDCHAWDREDVDVTQIEELRLKIVQLPEKPEAIINCVAYNDVDGAETNKEIAFKLNSEVPGNLAALCKELNIPLVHFTSQLIFDGEKQEYIESGLPHPISVYGESKYQGEQNIQKNTDQFYIIRTSVLFGPKGKSELSKKSFLELMLDLSAKSDTIKAVDDEISSVTFVNDLTQNIQYMLQSKLPYGIYHVTNSGSCSWYELAKELFAIKHIQVKLEPVPASSFPRAARRPHKAILLNTKLPAIRTWQEALSEYLHLTS